MKVTFDTQTVDGEQRVDAWRAAVTDTFIPIGVEDYRRQDFAARYDTFQVGQIALSRFKGTAQTFHRAPELIRNRDADFYVAVIQQDGIVSTEHHGHTEASLQGTITLIDVTKPYRVRAAGALDLLAVLVPREKLDRALGPTQNVVGLSIGPDQASTPLIRNFFSQLMSADEGSMPLVGERLAAIGVDLLAAGFAERVAAGSSLGQGVATVVYRAKMVIEDRLSDPLLDTVTVAHVLQISPRRLQEIFRAAELSIEDEIWRRRLLHSHKLLVDPACVGMSVGTIAYLCGFASQAHFARRFKGQFGMTPTDVRRGFTL